MKANVMGKYLFVLFLVITVNGCNSFGIGGSLDQRYQDAYKQVLADPNDSNIKIFMALSQEKGERDMQDANAKAAADTRESDKGFTDYFKAYGNDGFKRARQ